MDRRKIWNASVRLALYAAALLTGALLAGLIGYILWQGL